MRIKNKIADWWARNPMSYGKTHGTAAYQVGRDVLQPEFGSRGFFEQADAQLFAWNTPLHAAHGKFARLFPFETYRKKQVLEIGCGMGAMAMLWAQQGALITAVDLNPFSIKQTKKRFELYGLTAQNIQTEDANALSFADDSFDYVYSWGVLHHSPEFSKSLSEVFRVLKPNGEYGLMVYNRQSLYHFYHTRYVEGFLHGESKFLNHLELSSRYGDGHREEGNPFTWPMTQCEMQTMLHRHTRDVNTRLLGTELGSSFKFMLPGLSFIIPRIVYKCWARRFGWSIWCYGRKV